MLGEEVSPKAVAGQVNLLVEHLFPDRWETRLRKKPLPSINNQRDRRRDQYATIQKLFKLKQKDAAHSILDGSWRTVPNQTRSRPDGLEEYWRGVFESPKTELILNIHEGANWKWNILDPVSEEEAKGGHTES